MIRVLPFWYRYWAEMLSGPLALALSSELKAPQLRPHHTKGQQVTDEGPQGTCQGPVCLIMDGLD